MRAACPPAARCPPLAVGGHRTSRRPPARRPRALDPSSDDGVGVAVAVDDPAPLPFAVASEAVPFLLPPDAGVPRLDDAVASVAAADLLVAAAAADEAPSASSSPPLPSPSFFTPAVRGMLAINLSALLFGSNMAVTKLVEGGGGGGGGAGLSPAALCAARFAVAAACFAPSVPAALASAGVRTASVELGAYLAVGYLAQAWGLLHTTASHGAFAAAFTVLAVPFIDAAAGRKAVPPSTWAAAAVAVAGVALLTSDGGAPPTVGDAACVASAVVFGLHKWRSEALTDAHRDATAALVGGQLAVLAAASAVAAAPDAAARRTALEGLLVCGGGAGASGVPDDLAAAVGAAVAHLGAPPLIPVPDYMPGGTLGAAAWCGAAVLSRVVFGAGQQLTKAEYDEHGPSVVHKKCTP
jgi:drug/metabolite transporter (DMT)-like permease